MVDPDELPCVCFLHLLWIDFETGIIGITVGAGEEEG
jgi:hypothetical protein